MHDIDMELKLQLEGNHIEARKISDKLEKLGIDKIPTNEGQPKEDIWMRHSFNRGWFLIQDGDYQSGSKLLENGRYLNVYGSPPLNTPAPIFNPSIHDIKGKNIIVSLEGGYGDEIIHSRFATSYKKLGAEKVYLAAAPELVSLLSRIEGVDGVILRNQTNTVKHDYWIPGFSSGWVAGHEFGKNFPSKPYLNAKPSSVDVWKNIINSDKIKVGIRWAGNPKFEHQQFRKFPEEFLINLSKYKEIQVYSLQRDHNLVQLPNEIIDLQHTLLSWEDTAAAIMNLDIVITSCTSIAHLSAALGKETWVIVPILPYHTWTPGCPDSTKSEYYECVTLFRQELAGEWNDTFQKLYQSLEKRFDLEHIDLPNEDKKFIKLNLGCGLLKQDKFINVDKSSLVNPDEVVDLNNTPWPWKDNSVDHIIAKSILEHLGETNEDFIEIIKEMYRVSTTGAIWEIEVPHWRCDVALDDLTHKRLITPGMFNLFNKQLLVSRKKRGFSDSLLAFEHNVDIEICDIQFEYTDAFESGIKEGSMSQEQIIYALNHMNNVATATRLLIQVHKPGRCDLNEIL